MGIFLKKGKSKELFRIVQYDELFVSTNYRLLKTLIILKTQNAK